MFIYKYIIFLNFIWIVYCISQASQKNRAVAAPFFFLCQYHSQTNQPGLTEGEIILSVHIKGNPEFYNPGEIYEVIVSSNSDFDGFMMTGIYTLPDSTAKSLSLGSKNPFLSSQYALGHNMMCAIVHSHISHNPSKSLSFLWMAPTAGNGCIDFLATATLGQEVLFKDILALQICEIGTGKKDDIQPEMKDIHSSALVLREDFESSDVFDQTLWSKVSRGKLDEQCGNILHGKAASFCEQSGSRSLVSVPLNTTLATSLQFAIGVGNCTSSTDDPKIDISYGINKCNKWQILDSLETDASAETTVHIICLPPEARSADVCFRWHQQTPKDGSNFQGCWGVDNIVISSAADYPKFLEDNFDPVDPGNWLFFPGGKIKKKCQGDGNALVFHGKNNNKLYATSRDLNLKLDIIKDDIIFSEEFEKNLGKLWLIKGGNIGQQCGVVHLKKALVMSGEGAREVCTPYLDSSNIGSLRFYFVHGGDNCIINKKGILHDSPIKVYAETNSGEQVLITNILHTSGMPPHLVILPVPIEAQTFKTKFCWQQTNSAQKNKNVWAIDTITFLPWLPSSISHVVQFKLNLNCGGNSTENNVIIEFSSDHGHNWYSLHEFCLPPSCNGSHSALKSHFHSSEYQGWRLISLPLPYPALVDGSRLQFLQSGNYNGSNWAIDDVYIGACPTACNGHGKCTANGCQCDMGYSGDACQDPVLASPSFLSEMFPSSNLQSSNIREISGAEISYQCGILGSGKAVVFKKAGQRLLMTRDVNTTQNRFLQLTVRLGSPSFSGVCSSPNHPSEAVYIHSSCNGKLTWDLIEVLDISKYQDPRHLSFPLPENARKNSCYFLIWQPYHSGDGNDVWAIDDIIVSNSLNNLISLNFSDTRAINESIRYNFGAVKEHCKSDGKSLSFDGDVHSSSTRSLETKSLNIGPSYMLQFDIVVGCGQSYSKDKKNKVHLEYSTNHGMNWQLVHKPCLPSIGSCNGVFTKGTVYDPSEYRKWKRVTINLPSTTWSSSTRFRFLQRNFEEGDTWAVDNLYIGLQCSDLCSGHGRCIEGICQCDQGFYGKSCLPKEKLKAVIKKNFETPQEIEQEGFEINGGTVVSAEEGCGIITSGGTVYFYQDGVRQLITTDLDTESIDFVQFFIRIGGGDPLTCNNASERNESVLFQYSNDAGISWSLLRELYSKNYRQPRMEHISLPFNARTKSTRLRWWQPQHSGEGKDQWALDDLYLDINENQYIEKSEKSNVPISHQTMWSATTKTTNQPWCGSINETLLFNGEEKIKFAISKPLDLYEGQVIMFQISVGCTEKFSWNSAVAFEYSLDAGVTWQLAKHHCYPDSGCTKDSHEASIYYSGLYSNWTRILIPVKRDFAQSQVLIRWIQDASEYYNWPPAPKFALKNVYIGSPCPLHCLGHGDCTPIGCICDNGYEGPTCTSMHSNPFGFMDRFDQGNKLNHFWIKSLGSSFSTGCGTLSLGKSLYFGDEGYRLAETRDFDTRQIRSLQFVIRLGDTKNTPTCHRPQRRNENVFVEYSNNHGLTWNLIREIDYKLFSTRAVSVALDLPWEARTKGTSFRWWQPLGKSARDPPRAEWALDNILILISNTNPDGFQDNFSPIQIESWFLTQNGYSRQGCLSKDNALIFSSENVATDRYAETWDFYLQSSAFLQFDINMGCSHLTELYSVQLEYSIDRGRSWSPVNQECIPPEVGCHGYQLGSTLLSEKHINWTRVTVYLPDRAISPATRFRWKEFPMKSTGHTWALDNVYLGNGCPWMCSGHGYCDIGKCICDSGFIEPYCVPKIPLPCEMKDTFDNPSVNTTIWTEIYGAEISSRCGVLVSGTALTFWKEGLRMAITQDLDLSAAQYVQFVFRYGCRGSITSNVTRANGILLQYSNNGGITWHLLKELHYATEIPSSYFIIPIKDHSVRTNATRLRLWQPRHGGFGLLEWAIDNFIIGGMIVNPNILYDPVETSLQTDSWLFWPGSEIGSYCTSDRRKQSIVFESTEGERAIYTRDMIVSEDTVIQFEIKVGCGTVTLPEDPVRLEYSVDQGRSWNLVKASWVPYSLSPNCLHQVETPTIFYSNVHLNWQRIMVPLKSLQICGNVRFRWYQGFYTLRDSPPDWALDEIYIGPSCPFHCFGHGTCLNGIMCLCDSGYESEFCHNTIPNPSFLKESFEDIEIDNKIWKRWSGAEISHGCGILITGASLHFRYHGERMLVTHDLDLTQISAVQFYLKLGCGSRPSSPEEQPVLLQYSNNGGVTWDLLEEFGFGEETHDSFPAYIAIELPQRARTNSTQLRWWQPSSNGIFQEEWAIDHIFIGGDINGLLALNDDFTTSHEANWILTPGSIMEPVCGGRHNFLHFRDSDDSRYAVTTDVIVSETTYIQFQIAMGCKESPICYDISLEYSTDMGKTWSLARKHCFPSDVDCMEYFEPSIYFSDVYPTITRITLPLPSYTRTHNTRFRWIQHPGFKSSQTWAVGHVYIGDECPDMCTGHGKCSIGACSCDDGWAGASCNEPKSPLPSELRDQFLHNPSSAWYQINGGVVSDLCGPVGSGSAFHFYGPCTRQIITKDLDLRNATLVQYYFRFGCITSPSSREQGVFLQFSSNGGITWITAKEMRFDQHKKSSYIAVPLPIEMNQNGVRVRWWQPDHNGRAHSDWAIDSIYIGGTKSAPNNFSDLWEGNFLSPTKWLAYNNIAPGHYCGSINSVAIGDATTNENASLETIDLHIKEDYILQFMISLGCNASWNDPIIPVKLEFSIDYGQTWHYVVPQFLPADPGFNGIAQHPSIYQAPMKWQRIIIPLTGLVISKWTRFRWNQELTQELSVSHKWGIKDIYIGPACQHNCFGHGICYKLQCKCDKGYSGEYCGNVTANVKYFKDTFNYPKIDTTYWSQIFGGKIGQPCQPLIEGTSVVFNGWGLRILETTDMDLRDAKFIQYIAQLGGNGDGIACIDAQIRNQSILLQFSTDGGISWNLIHELDYTLYFTPRKDYLLLPTIARTSASRIRWWQATNLGINENYKESITPSWALDNIHIGGTQINPPELYEDFQNNINEQNWWFHPHGQIKNRFCSNDGDSMVWLTDINSGERSITTRELIIGENYMIQFSIIVDCDKLHQCISNHSIKLEYSKNPGSNIWEEVQKECLPSNSMDHPDCSPYQLHLSSQYSANDFNIWTLITIMLPEKTYSSSTQFRWIQISDNSSNRPISLPSWGLDDIYIGEACPEMCWGRGKCIKGKCVCDTGYSGIDCYPAKTVFNEISLLTTFTDGFEEGIKSEIWCNISGGKLGTECGSLAPNGHGKHLYFGECRLRQAMTCELDGTIASKIMFVIRIGTPEGSALCHINSQTQRLSDKSVLFQYTVNNGITWELIAIHSSQDFLTPRRVVYEIPAEAKVYGVKFRWWQPFHDGPGHDQWALDNVEFIALAQQEGKRYRLGGRRHFK